MGNGMDGYDFLNKKIKELEKENAKLKKQKEEIEIEFSDIKMIEDLERLQKENALAKNTIEQQHGLLKEKIEENAALKEKNADLQEIIGFKDRDLKEASELLGKLSKETEALKERTEALQNKCNWDDEMIKEFQEQIVQYDAANEKLRKENEKLKANLETAVDNLVLTSESEPDLPEFIPTEVRCDFCNYLMGTMIEWGQSIVTDSECPICKSDRFVFVNKKEAGK